MKYYYHITIINKNKMSQDTQSNNVNELDTIINDKFLNYIKERKYKELTQLTVPFVLNSENKIIKKIAYNFYILLLYAVNQSNLPPLLFLSEAIEHVIEHFTPELIKLFNNTINIQTAENDANYLFLDDIIKVLKEQLLYKNKLEDIKEFLLKI
jgi:hypothetical protein